MHQILVVVEARVVYAENHHRLVVRERQSVELAVPYAVGELGVACRSCGGVEEVAEKRLAGLVRDVFIRHDAAGVQWSNAVGFADFILQRVDADRDIQIGFPKHEVVPIVYAAVVEVEI